MVWGKGPHHLREPGILGLKREMLRKSLEGSFPHPGGVMTNETSIRASWDMVFGDGQGEGADDYPGEDCGSL